MIIATIRRYFSFKGKATRLEFWMGCLLIPLVVVVLLSFLGYLLSSSGFVVDFFLKFLQVFIFVASLILYIWLLWAAAVRRCHDLCISSNYIFLFLIPIISTLTFFVFAFAKVDASKLSDNTKLKQLKRVLRWHLKALVAVAAFVFFWAVVFLIEH